MGLRLQSKGVRPRWPPSQEDRVTAFARGLGFGPTSQAVGQLSGEAGDCSHSVPSPWPCWAGPDTVGHIQLQDSSLPEPQSGKAIVKCARAWPVWLKG